MSKYVNISTKEEVTEEDALVYASTYTFANSEIYEDFLTNFCWERGSETEVFNLLATHDKETENNFVDWFFSGNWIKEEGEEEND